MKELSKANRWGFDYEIRMWEELDFYPEDNVELMKIVSREVT